jgi:hypothetical protein
LKQFVHQRYTSHRTVASMYSWGGVGQKFPNDEHNFRIFHGIRSHEGVCYPENEEAIYKQKYAYFIRHITEACSAVGSSCWLGSEKRVEGHRKVLNLESLKYHFLDFVEVLTEFWWSENSVLVIRNLQFAYNLVVRRRI